MSASRQRRRNIDLVRAVEESVELIKLLLADRVVLVVVATRAADRQPKPHSSHGTGSVHDLLHSVLLHIGTTLAIIQSIAVEAGSYLLIDGGIRQQISSKLLDSELIERDVLIERLDDPFAIEPSRRICTSRFRTRPARFRNSISSSTNFSCLRPRRGCARLMKLSTRRMTARSRWTLFGVIPTRNL